MVHLQRLVDEFIELVKIDSESGHERQICDVLIRKFRSLGCSVVEDRSAQQTGYEAGNLIASLEATDKDAPPIYFTCHMDTVNPGKQVKPSIRDGYIVSDGTTVLGSDDKAGIAALLEALRLLREKQLPHGLIQFVITVGEESGLVGAKHIDRSALHAEYGYALDSNGPVGEIVTSCPAHMELVAHLYGKAAHAGLSPEAGVSAIQIASRAIAKMKLGRIDHETTANIGRFQGGDALNIVPDTAKVEAEVRSLSMEKLHKQIDHMIQMLQEAATIYRGRVEVKKQLSFESFRYTQKDPVVKKAMNAIRRIGREPYTIASGGGSDANIFNGYGIPTVNLGIGYEEIHTTRERMPILELRKAAELVFELVKESAIRHEGQGHYDGSAAKLASV